MGLHIVLTLVLDVWQGVGLGAGFSNSMAIPIFSRDFFGSKCLIHFDGGVVTLVCLGSRLVAMSLS